MQRTESTIDPDGPLTCTLETLEHLRCFGEMEAIQYLVRDRAYYREQTFTLSAELARQVGATERAERGERMAQRVARQCLQQWRSLALLHESREELARIEALARQHSFLYATPA